MDTTDPNIVFNDKGESDYFTNFQKVILPKWNYGQGRTDELLKFAEKIRKENKNKKYRNKTKDNFTSYGLEFSNSR